MWSWIQDEEKAEIVQHARNLFEHVFMQERAGIVVVRRAACLYQTACLMVAGAKKGRRLMPQAGTAAWPRLDIECFPDDPHTHFAYEWQGSADPLTRARASAGLMPEMHIWAADMDSREIIDITTKYAPEQCVKQAKLPWKNSPPPDFFWGGVDDLPDYWMYKASLDAIEFIADDFADTIQKIALVLKGYTLTDKGHFTTATKEMT